MAYESVKNQIDAYIKANGVNLITGPVLNAVLTTMLDELGEGYAFQGVLNTTDTPSPAADIPQAWLAAAGSYLGGAVTVDEGELALIIHTADGWSKETVYRGVQLSHDAILDALGYTPADEADLAEKQDTITDLSAIRSGAALGSTSVQPVDIKDMVKAEPIGSIVPPVNPSEFATKEEVSQLGQEIIVSDEVPTQVTTTRNLRPTSNGVLTGNNGYSYIVPVTVGGSIHIQFQIESGQYLRYGFTQNYPAAGAAVVGYGDMGSQNRDVRLTAPISGYLLAEVGTQPISINILQPSGNTIGKDVFDLKGSVTELSQKKVGASDFYGVNPPSNLLYLSVVVAGYIDSAGTITSSSSYKTSDYIEVSPSTQMALSYVRFSCQYDSTKKAITTTTDHSDASSAIITTNESAKYIRVSISNRYLSLAQVSVGSSVSPYSKYLVNVPFIGIPFENVSDVSLKMGQISGAKQSLNLFDANNVVSGYLAAQGNLTPSDSYRTTDFIPVESASNYALGYVRFVCQYDDTKQTISGTYVDKNNAAQSTIETVATAKYIRVSVTTGNVYRGQINAGNSLATYDEFGYSLPSLIVPKSKFAGKKAVCFGDSITGSVYEMDTNNWCMYLKMATGMDVINQGYWSGRVAYSDDSAAVINAFAFYELVDSIVSGNWSRQDIIYSTPGYEQHAAQLEKLKQIDFTKVDFLTIALGTNDLSSDTPFEIDGQPMSVESVNGAFRYTISKLLTNYPQLHIIIMTPIYRFTPSTGDDYMVNGRGVQSFVDDYKELGAELRIPVLNMFNDIGVNKYNRSYYWGANGGDGLHPISTMKQVMGNKVAGFLTSTY